jgi:hypothetical protein
VSTDHPRVKDLFESIGEIHEGHNSVLPPLSDEALALQFANACREGSISFRHGTVGCGGVERIGGRTANLLHLPSLVRSAAALPALAATLRTERT